MSLKYSEAMKDLGIFTERQLVRMQDGELLAELCRALQHGIETWSSAKLDRLYDTLDEDFQQEADFERAIDDGFELMFSLPELARSSLMTRYQVYSLILAAAHAQGHAPKLASTFEFDGDRPGSDPSWLATNFGELADAVSRKLDRGPLSDFVKASTGGTNTLATRTTRFTTFCKALLPKSILSA